jgi:nicotinamidase-related amidase
MSPGVREKYATSEPEMNADAIIRRIRKIISVPRARGDPVAAARAIIPVNEPAGSVSKIIRVGYLEWQVICSVIGAEVFCRFFSC